MISEATVRNLERRCNAEIASRDPSPWQAEAVVEGVMAELAAGWEWANVTTIGGGA